MNNRQDVIDNLEFIFDEIREVNTKWHINADGSRKDLDPDFYPRCILLMGSELSEAFEAIRKGNQPDSHLPQYPGESVELVDLFIRAIDFIVFNPEWAYLAELLHAMIAIDLDLSEFDATQIEVYMTLDDLISKTYNDHINVTGIIDLIIAYCDREEIPLLEIYRAKTEYNRNRADHKPEARAAAGGKQF